MVGRHSGDPARVSGYFGRAGPISGFPGTRPRRIEAQQIRPALIGAIGEAGNGDRLARAWKVTDRVYTERAAASMSDGLAEVAEPAARQRRTITAVGPWPAVPRTLQRMTGHHLIRHLIAQQSPGEKSMKVCMASAAVPIRQPWPPQPGSYAFVASQRTGESSSLVVARRTVSSPSCRRYIGGKAMKAITPRFLQ